MFIIYGRDNCSWCDAAKALLNDNAFVYTYKNIETSKEDLEAFRRDFPNAKTVPQILFDYNQIGGYEDLRKWLKPSTTK